MTQSKFISLCNEHHVAPEIALENDDLVQALKDKNDTEVERILMEEF